MLLALGVRGRLPSDPVVWDRTELLHELRVCGCTRLLEDLELPHTFAADGAALRWVRSLLSDEQASAPASLAFLPSRLAMQGCAPSERKAQGEFYTPRWLVELALQRVGWPSGSDALVDPACGAGAFLAGAALALRHRPSAEVARRISGSDLNPLAVLGARVACLCAVADLLEPGEPFEPDIRIGDLLDDTPRDAADVIVGNPPWIRFSEVEPTTQARVVQVARHYDLVPARSFHGGSELDVSAVFAYRMLDGHLRLGGRAALVLPSSLLRSSSSGNFRRFVLPDGTSLGLDHVTDFGTLNVFSDAGAANRTALLCWTKGKTAPASVPGELVDKTKRPDEAATWEELRTQLPRRACEVRFAGKDRRLALLPAGAQIAALEGATEGLRGRKGVTTDLNGAYFVRVIGPGSSLLLLRVANDVTHRGKAVPAHTFEVERELVFPLLKGARQIRPFRIEAPTLAVILPNRRVNAMTDTLAFEARFPHAYGHFRWIEEQTGGALSARSTYRRMLAHTKAPFFSVYNVGDYTFAPFKVVWAEISRSLVAGIAHESTLGRHAHAKVVVPDHKVYFAPFDDLSCARFLCALLNSTPVRSYVDAVTEKLQVGALLDRVRLPAFDPTDEGHQHLVALSQRAADHFDEGVRGQLDEAVADVLARATAS